MKHHHTSFFFRVYLRLNIVALLSYPFSVSAQEEPAFPNEYAEWQTGFSWMSLPPNGPWDTHMEYFEAYPSPDSDTLMNLFKGNWLGNYYSTDNKVYFSFVSDDRPSHFQFDADTGVYYLLYDFTMEVGDTAYTDEGGTGDAYPVTIESITMEDVSGAMLKHFHLSNGDIIVEKIGSLQGLFRPYTRAFETVQSLCYYGGTFLTPNNNMGYGYNGDFCVHSSTGLETNEMNELTPYPIPAGDLLHVNAKFPISACQVYSTTGTVVEIPNSIQDNKLELVVSELSPGGYFLKLTGHNETSQTLYFIKN